MKFLLTSGLVGENGSPMIGGHALPSALNTGT